MKSRNFLHSTPIENQDSATKGFLLARSPQGDVAASSAVRRFELQHNSSPRFARRRKERRQGQALLLAVLIMLIAALLSAGFLGVVSGNLNQSARIADKTRAIEASRAGIAFANAQLSGSSQGDLWRPIDVSPAPDPTSANVAERARYEFYYSQLEKVQGWAAQGQPKRSGFPTGPIGDEDFRITAENYRNNTYGKFPDPNQVAGDAPKFLVKAEELTTDPTAADYDVDHAGEIKITSIGLSEDDPNVFHRSVAYKVGRKKSPWASALRSVSNWNFGNAGLSSGVPYGKVNVAVTATAGATATAPVVNVDVPIETRINNEGAPQFSASDVPFNVVIVNKSATSSVRGAVVTAVTAPVGPSTVATLRLARVEEPITANDTIQKAAAIGTGSTIDLLNTGQIPSPGNPMTFPTQSQPSGILTNGSMWLQGQVQLSDLNKFGAKIISSGSIALDGASKPVVAPAPIPNPPPNYGIAGDGTLVSSSANNFPGTFTTDSGINVTPADLVDDGWNKINAQTLGLDYSTSRDVEPFKPAKIDSAENLARYRALTRNSSAAGVYIDNRDDVEKVSDNAMAVPPTFKAMTQQQLLDMLNSSATVANTAANNYVRVGEASPIADATKSLEQKHLRGWVGPDEFLARGALVELILNGSGVPKLRVTYDARSETAPNGPDSTKTLRDPDTGNLQPGVYSRVVDWPSNGTLFAEGNIRIRGSVQLPLPPVTGADPFPSLTVVSLNNIYIEGALSLDNRTFDNTANGGTATDPSPNRKKLILLAKKNVIVNPTRLVLGHVDAQTLSTAAVNVAVGANTGLAVAVSDSSNFQLGDRVTLDTTNGIVTNILSATQIEIATNNGTASPVVIPTNSPVKLTQWKDEYDVTSHSLKVSADRAIYRRVLLPNAAVDYPNLRLDLDHVGSRPAAPSDFPFKIETEDESATIVKPAGLEVKVTNKRVDANGTIDRYKPIIERDDKKLRATYNLPNAPDVDIFRDPTATPFVDDADAKTFSLDLLEIALNAPNPKHIQTPPPLLPDLPEGWKYVSAKGTALAADNITPRFPNGTPAFYLAAVGLRDDKFTPAPATPDRGIQNIGPNGTELNIPLATSVRLMRNNAQQSLTSTYTGFNTLSSTEEVAEYTVPYFGFNPGFGVASGGEEDILTVDQSFYQTDADILKSTLDSRRLVAPYVTGDAISLRQNNDLLGLVTQAPTLPDYRVRALKLENAIFPAPAATNSSVSLSPVNLGINAYVYAQEGSWLVIPGDKFRTERFNTPGNGNSVRSDATGTASYIDFNNDNTANAGEYVNGTNPLNDVNNFDAEDFADLNRNGIKDPGEAEAALRFVRYNYTINFFGAIVENQTAVVADVANPTAGALPLVNGAVQDWMNKWAAYDSTIGDADKRKNFKFITYVYDPSIAINSPGANQLRVPVTDDLLYQQ